VTTFPVARNTVTTFKIGEVQISPRDTTHSLANTDTAPLEFITVAVQ